ncbi:MAG: beta-lactamase family protein [Propionibacteriaceae bacterium]|nr:beta-lactamase family protein [Propionibacteriaceae bacterium]
MTRNDEILAQLPDLWSAAVDRHGVPGAQIAVLADGIMWEAAAGKLSLTTGVDVTTDSVFQIGSITKVWTTTLVMQLVDDGLIGLDDLLITHMPEFALGDMTAAQEITIRQLLSHTAGFDGDIFRDTGRGEDAIEKFVASLDTADQVFPPGTMFSYNNTAFAVLGRLIEKKRGAPWAQVLTDRIVTPLGLTNVCPSADEAILRRAAVGHMDGPDGPVATTTWALPRSNQAAGAMLAMSAHDLVRFAQMHLNDGLAPDGTRLLSPESVAAMQTAQVEVPPLRNMGDSWGLGWDLTHTDQGLVIHHTGGTIGQAAFLCVIPEQQFAIAALTNGGGCFDLYLRTVLPLMQELTGVALPERHTPPANPSEVDMDRIGGTYSDASFDFTVRRDADGTLWLDRVPKGIEAELGEQPTSTIMAGVAPDLIVAQEPTAGIYPVYAFVGRQDDGRATHIHYGRAVRRAD